MIRHFLPAALAASLLTGCLSPEASCFAQATAEYRALRRETREIEATLARGYAIQTTELDVALPITCHEGSAVSTCLATRAAQVDIPVAIDPAHQHARLSRLRAKIERARPRAMRAAAACNAGPSSRVLRAPRPAPSLAP